MATTSTTLLDRVTLSAGDTLTTGEAPDLGESRTLDSSAVVSVKLVGKS